MAGWGRPTWRALGFSALIGALAALGQAPLGLWPVTLVVLSFAFRAIAGAEDARAAAWLAWATGTGYFLLALSWLVEPFLIDPLHYAWMIPFAMGLMCGGLALFWAAAGGLAHRIGRGTGDRALFLTLALTAAEVLRGYVFTGFPWAMIGHVWIGTAWAQLAAFLGAGGLTLLACLVAALPVVWPKTGVFPALALLLASFFLAQTRLALPEPAAREASLRLVQPNAPQHLKWDPDQAAILFKRLITLSREGGPGVDLVIWPETSLPYQYEPALAETIAQSIGTSVAVGAQVVEGEAAFNSLVVLGPEGRQNARYDKAHLVPFGEYVPFGEQAWNWFGLRAFAAQQGYGYAAGPGPRVLDLGPRLGKVLPVICYEAVFPQYLRGAPERADWILQITNDAWFGSLTGPFQHLAQSRLRAIEQGLPLVRVGNTGVTAVIDARGFASQSLPFQTEGRLDVTIPGALPEPLYARHGELPLILLLFTLFATFFGISRRKPA